MIIQAYSDGLCRMFPNKNNSEVCEFTVGVPLKKEVDKRLKLLGWKRREKWRDYTEASFSEAKLRRI